VSKKYTTLRERVTALEVKIEELTKQISNHCSAHKIDRIVQAINLLGIAICLYLLKIALLK